MLKKKVISLGLGAFLMGTSLSATDIDVSITNLTKGFSFTPLLVAAHPNSYSSFTAGSAASASLEAMAEGGSLTELQADITNDNANSQINANIANGLLAPGASATTTIADLATTNTNLTILSMIVPTNDAFVALNSLTIPTVAGIYTYDLNAYDSGTEGNSELVADIPNPASLTLGTGGTGVVPVGTGEGYVHIHRGILGDTNSTGGVSDLDSTQFRWLNPVARVTITVR